MEIINTCTAGHHAIRMERKEFKISITMKNAKKRNEGKGQQQEKKKQKTRGKIVTVARQRALNIVKSHVW